MTDTVFLVIVIILLVALILLNMFLVYIPIQDANNEVNLIREDINKLIVRFGPPIESFLAPIIENLES